MSVHIDIADVFEGEYSFSVKPIALVLLVLTVRDLLAHQL